MPPHTRSPGLLRSRWTFFRQWMKDPRSVSSIAPSGVQLARRMMSELPPGAQRVIELGAGTGVFTAALLDAGIEPRSLMVVELNPPLVALLESLYPSALVVQGDAAELPALATASGFAAAGPADAVVSGLGMLSIPRAVQRRILEGAFSQLRQGGRFIQFTYGHANPVAASVLAELGLHTRRGELAWRNLPPATVFIYTRNFSTRVVPRSMAG